MSTQKPIGCRANVTFNSEELNVIIGFGDDPVVNEDSDSPWYGRDIEVFYYLSDYETDMLHDAVNGNFDGYAVDGELEILIDDEFTYIYS